MVPFSSVVHVIGYILAKCLSPVFPSVLLLVGYIYSSLSAYFMVPFSPVGSRANLADEFPISWFRPGLL